MYSNSYVCMYTLCSKQHKSYEHIKFEAKFGQTQQHSCITYRRLELLILHML